MIRAMGCSRSSVSASTRAPGSVPFHLETPAPRAASSMRKKGTKFPHVGEKVQINTFIY